MGDFHFKVGLVLAEQVRFINRIVEPVISPPYPAA
jgi:hypothetical protein